MTVFLSAILLIFMIAGQDAAAAMTEPESSTGENRIDIAVHCAWDDAENRDGLRPDHITVTLYANGKDTGSFLTLTEANSWTGCFEKMPTVISGDRQSYSIIGEGTEGYTVTISGSDLEGYQITNIHEPFPEGRSGQEQIEEAQKPRQGDGTIVATVVTTKVSKSMPVRTSTSTKKTKSVKTADISEPTAWGIVLLGAAAVLYMWMRHEQKRR